MKHYGKQAWRTYSWSDIPVLLTIRTKDGDWDVNQDAAIIIIDLLHINLY